MGSPFDLVCLSHLRWDFVYQRPHHLLSRCAREQRVFFVEEPFFDAATPHVEVGQRRHGVHVAVPHLPEGLCEAEIERLQRNLMAELFRAYGIDEYVLWYYTPMALGFTRHLEPLVTVYDCMDELAAFALAPPALRAREQELLARADLVFTGGQSLYEVKRRQHPFVYAFPSSVDGAHFARARAPMDDPADQAGIPRPRLGFYGVIDERMDLDLLAGLAEARPEWQLVLVGPVVKIDPAILPRHANIHYLGPKSYDELPAYLGGWDVALLPFARNEATRYISPTKTPEYLAAGKPVVSTAIHDVVHPYGEAGLVRIADTPAEMVAAVAAALDEDERARMQRVDAFLSQMSWDRTWERMLLLLHDVIDVRQADRADAGEVKGSAIAAVLEARAATSSVPHTPAVHLAARRVEAAVLPETTGQGRE